MELLTIILSSLLAIASPVGLISDQITENTLRSYFHDVEILEVRIDNAPSYQILQGKVQRLLIAGRGLEIIPGVRIDTLELETDALDLELNKLRQKNWREALSKPLKTGVRLVLTEKDLNQVLQSEDFQVFLQRRVNQLAKLDFLGKDYKLLNPRCQLLGNNRLEFQMQLQKVNSQAPPLEINLELGIGVIGGRKLDLLDLGGTVNGRKLSLRLLNTFAKGISQILDLQVLEKEGITARILQLDITEEEINLATFIQIDKK
jgi:hypothetical protein